jgi:hypothetical protein
MPTLSETDDWAVEEFGAADLGDARRTQRLIALARRLVQSPHCSFPNALNNADLKAAYRFFDNKHVDPENRLGAHLEQTLARMQPFPVVLVAQDTTEFNLTHLEATTGLGYTSHACLRGFFLHSELALTPEGLPLGVMGFKTWTRPLEQWGKRHQRTKLPITEKESMKWVEGLQHLCSLKEYCPRTQIVGVCDREADVYELFIAERPAGVDWLVRAAWNRNVDHPEHYLWEYLASAPVLGETQLQVPVSGSRAARIAPLEIRCAPVHLRAPRSRSKLDEVDLFAVWAIEKNAPAETTPIEWMLLTSVPTQSCDEALERLSWYARRWTIESWHRVLKSGCQIEVRQFGTVDRFIRATALFAVIGWRILYATLLARLESDLSCVVLWQTLEWQALYCRTHGTTQVPKQPPTLAEAVLWIAKLGGYLNRKNDRPPGATVLWRGFLALHESVEMFRIFRKNESEEKQIYDKKVVGYP